MNIYARLNRFPPSKKFKDTENANKPEPKTTTGRRGFQVSLFEDLPTMNHTRAYSIIYENDTCFIPLQKRGWKCGSFEIAVEGGGERGEAMDGVMKQTMGLHSGLEYLSYGVTEGWRGLWLKARPHGKINVLDIRAAGCKRIQAEGNYWWDGYDNNNVVRFAPVATLSNEDTDIKVPRERMLVFCPSADVNPNGDTRQAQNLLTIANLSALLVIAEHVYTERFSIPKEIIKRVMDGMNPDDVQNAFDVAVDDLETTNAMQNMVLDNKEILEIVEAKGKTWEFLEALRRSLDSRAHKLVTGENLTSDQNSGGGDKGSSELADKQFFGVARYIMKQMEEPWTYEALPFAERINDWWLPPAKKKDSPMRVVFKPAVEKQRLTVSEGLGIIDRFYPVTYSQAGNVFGLTVPKGIDPNALFIKPGAPVAKTEEEEEETEEDTDMDPSSTGEGEQRKDRQKPDDDMPAKNDKNPNDRRNIAKDDK